MVERGLSEQPQGKAAERLPLIPRQLTERIEFHHRQTHGQDRRRLLVARPPALRFSTLVQGHASV